MKPVWYVIIGVVSVSLLIAVLQLQSASPSQPVSPAIAPANGSDANPDGGGSAEASGLRPPPDSRVPAGGLGAVSSGEGQSDPDLRRQLAAGLIERQDFAGDYDAVIRRIAGERITGFTSGAREGRVARLCGFDDWDAMASILASDSPAEMQMRVELEGLLASATEAVASLESHLADAWDDQNMVEVLDPDNPHNSMEWMADRGISREQGAASFRRSARVGDRQFTLHFSSKRYPQLDQQLSMVSEASERFWETWGSR